MVIGIKDLKVIIFHFYRNPLIAKKRADFVLFKRGFALVIKGGNESLLMYIQYRNTIDCEFMCLFKGLIGLL